MGCIVVCWVVFVKVLLALSIACLLLAFGCAAAEVNEGVGSDGRAFRGSAAPKVVVYEYSDFECPYCQKGQPAVDAVMRAYQEKGAQLRFMHYPLPSHPRSLPASLAAVCAEKQGKFWEMHDKLYANREALEDSDLEAYATGIGLDMAAYAKCISSPDAQAVIEADMQEGKAAGVRATPTFVIGQSMVEGASQEKISQAIELELARQG